LFICEEVIVTVYGGVFREAQEKERLEIAFRIKTTFSMYHEWIQPNYRKIRGS